MSRPLRLEYEGAIWHVTSRGNERRNIFRDRNDHSIPWEHVTGDVYPGSNDFCANVQERIEARAPAVEVPLRQRRLVHLPFDAVLSAVCRSFGETAGTLRQKNRRMGRKALAQLAREACGMTLPEIAGELVHQHGPSTNLPRQDALSSDRTRRTARC